MQALSDEQQMDRIEQRIDRLEVRIDGFEARVAGEFAAVRSEARADFRTLIGVLLAMFMTMILGFAGILIQGL
ncbi:MAG TPA: hypothetical protein VMH33_13640 [Solirubrobacterales bacterium]|nr:hypothetical protein [Solirubrobacterales bacterium]